MPTPPTFSQPSTIIGTTNLSTWGKLRSPVVSEYFNFTSGGNSLNVEAGFHPDECYFVRCMGWPYSEDYLDENNNPQTAYLGLITGYLFIANSDPVYAPGRSLIAIGAYAPAFSSSYYNLASLNNFLDVYDREDFWDGMTINGSYTATNDYYGDSTSYFWQELLNTSINGDTVDTQGPLTSLSGMTAF